MRSRLRKEVRDLHDRLLDALDFNRVRKICADLSDAAGVELLIEALASLPHDRRKERLMRQVPIAQDLRKFEQLLSMAQLASDPDSVAFATDKICAVFRVVGQDGDALTAAEGFLAWVRPFRHELLIGQALALVGGHLCAMGRLVEGRRHLQEALAIGERVGEPVLHNARASMVSVYASAGMHFKALELVRSLGAKYEAERNWLFFASHWDTLGWLHKELGQFSEAIEAHRTALALIEKDDEPGGEHARRGHRAVTHGNLAVAYTYVGMLDDALASAEREFQIVDTTGDQKGRLFSLGKLGRILLRTGQHSAAIARLTEMKRSAEQLGEIAARRVALANLADAYGRSRQHDQAIACALEACESERSSGAVSVEGLLILASVFEPRAGVSNHLACASVFVDLTLAALEALRRSINVSRAESVIERWIPLFERAITVAWRERSAHWEPLPSALDAVLPRIRSFTQSSPFIGLAPLDAGFRIAEAVRAQGYLERARLAELEADADEELVIRRREAELEMGRLQSRLMLLQGPGSDAERTQVEQQLRFAEEARDSAVKRLLEAHPTSETHVQEAVSIRDLQDTVAADEVFLLYVLTGQKGRRHVIDGVERYVREFESSGEAYVLVVSRSGTECHGIGLTSDISALAQRLLDQLFVGGSDSQVVAEFAAASHQLFRRLIPSAALSGAFRRLIVCADGLLNYVPFEVLVRDPGAACAWRQVHFCHADLQFSYEPSAQAFVAAHRKQRSCVIRRVAVAVGDPHYPNGGQGGELVRRSMGLRSDVHRDDRSWQLDRLPWSRLEVTELRKILTRDGAEPEGFFVGSRATKRTLLRAIQELMPDVVHIACHGIVADESVKNGALALSPEPDQPHQISLLTAAEITSISLGARLVTLSACRTAHGAFSRGEGIQGLVRAWKVSGAEAVVASLWSVQDETTSIFMTAFYESLFLGGQTVGDALAVARKRLSESDRTSHPFFWGAFVLWGRGGLCAPALEQAGGCPPACDLP